MIRGKKHKFFRLKRSILSGKSYCGIVPRAGSYVMKHQYYSLAGRYFYALSYAEKFKEYDYTGIWTGE
jgi:hypothetical protein